MTQYVFSLLVASLLCVVIACTDDPASGNNSDNNTDTTSQNNDTNTIDSTKSDAYGMSVKVGSELWDAPGSGNVSAARINGMVVITGIDPKRLEPIQVVAENAIGEFDVPGPYTNVSYQADQTQPEVWGIVSGTIKIEVLTSEQVKGSFSGTFANINDPSETLEMTEGKFNVKFQ